MSVEDSKKAFLLKEDGGRIRLENGLGRILLDRQPSSRTASPWLFPVLLFFFLGFAS